MCMCVCVCVCPAGKYTFFGKTSAMLQGPPEIGHLQKILLKVCVYVCVCMYVTGGSGWRMAGGTCVHMAQRHEMTALFGSRIRTSVNGAT